MLREPESMDECVYFTQRAIGTGHVKAWVFREKCVKCGKSLMGKPVDKKGKVKIRAKEYVCPSCGFTINDEEYLDTLEVSIQYTCPFCSNKSEIKVPFKRKKIQMIDEETGKKTSADAIRFQCEKCGKNIDITKKMKS